MRASQQAGGAQQFLPTTTAVAHSMALNSLLRVGLEHGKVGWVRLKADNNGIGPEQLEEQCGEASVGACATAELSRFNSQSQDDS